MNGRLGIGGGLVGGFLSAGFRGFLNGGFFDRSLFRWLHIGNVREIDFGPELERSRVNGWVGALNVGIEVGAPVIRRGNRAEILALGDSMGVHLARWLGGWREGIAGRG